MNKRDMQQLKASIAKDLIQGQGDNSATRDLLKQYVPLNGIVSKPEPEIRHEMPVENCLAPRATVAPYATLARHATLAPYARVKCELRVPNTINFSLFPTLGPFAKAVYYQLFLLSHGFRKDTCLINLPTLARLVLMSQRKVQNTIVYLESRGLVKRIGSRLGGESRGNCYQVLIPEDVPPSNPNIPPENCEENDTGCMAPDATLAPHTSLASHATVARGATIKNDDDDIKINHHQKTKNLNLAISLWKTTLARLRRERKKRLIFCLCAKRMKKRPAIAGANRIPKHTIKTASRMCRRKKSSRSWKPLFAERRQKSTASGISSRKSPRSRIRVTAPGRKNGLRKSFTKFGIFLSADPDIQWPILWRMSNAAAHGKVLCLRTICLTNW